MLDYYGSIIKSDKEVDREIIHKFRDRCYESYLTEIISDLRKEDVLQKEYSVSGWLTFFARNIYEIVEETFNYKKQKNEKKIKFLYCFNQLYNDMDICRLICDRI